MNRDLREAVDHDHLENDPSGLGTSECKGAEGGIYFACKIKGV